MKNFVIKIINNKKILIWVVVFLVVTFSYLLKTLTPSPKKTSTTKPIIVTATPAPQTKTPNVFPQQSIVFSWNNIKIDIPSKSKKFTITKPLINKDSVVSLSQTLGFTSNDLLKSIKSTDRTWQNSKGSLFTSIDQNQIIFNSKGNTPAKVSSVSKDEAQNISKSIISILFGEKTLNTLDHNPQIRFLKLKPRSYNPTETTNSSEAEYIEVSYKQSIDSYPLSAISGNTNLISIIIDNQRNLYRLELSGGYLEYTLSGEQSLIDFETLKTTASEKALKISSLSDVSVESQYFDSTTLDVSVDDGYFGYFLSNTNNIIPVVYISGKAKSNTMDNQQVIYVIPVTK